MITATYEQVFSMVPVSVSKTILKCMAQVPTELFEERWIRHINDNIESEFECLSSKTEDEIPNIVHQNLLRHVDTDIMADITNVSENTLEHTQTALQKIYAHIISLIDNTQRDILADITDMEADGKYDEDPPDMESISWEYSFRHVIIDATSNWYLKEGWLDAVLPLELRGPDVFARDKISYLESHWEDCIAKVDRSFVTFAPFNPNSITWTIRNIADIIEDSHGELQEIADDR